MRLRAILLALFASAAANAGWREAAAPNFRIVSDVPEDELRRFGDRLSRFDRALRLQRAMTGDGAAASGRVTIFLIADSALFRTACRCNDTVGGFWTQSDSGSYAYMPAKSISGSRYFTSETVLFHEYTHDFMFQNFPGTYPAWFREGFAEFYSTARINDDGSMFIGAPANHRTVEIALVPLHGLLPILGNTNTDQPGIYGMGWLATHYLMLNPQRAGQLDRYLKAIATGTPGTQAARDAFGSVETLEREMRSYIRKPLPGWDIRADALAYPPLAIRELSPGEAAVMPVRLRSIRGTGGTEAASIAREARRLAAGFAQDAAAQAALAEAEYDADNDAAADSAASQALARDPVNFRALIYKGRVAMHRAKADPGGGASKWREARSWFLKANRVDPDSPEALMLFYLSFVRSGERPSANAVAGLRRALELAPRSTNLRWLVVADYLRSGDIHGTRETLAPEAFDPHLPKGGLASSMIARIDAGETAASLYPATEVMLRQIEP
jgi:tetratricopeptide (TPR) repeat protein